MGHHLLVMGPELFATHPLPPRGLLTIGRAENADVRLDDPLASRHHARLHIGDTLQIEDLGSANKTRVRDVALAPGERVTIAPGEAVAIGSTILMVQQRLPPRVRVLRPHGYMEARLEEECARSEATRDPFALLRVQVASALAPARLTEIVAPVLRLPDMLALYGPNEYEVLLASTAPEAAEKMVRELEAALASAGAIVRTGLATYPRDGRTPEALVAAASRRVRGEASDRAAAVGNEIPHDAVMERVYKLAERAAAGTINVLIVGETGAGKEVLAERVHRMSPRAEKAFLCLNCASLSEHLLESELFGHERGAFTGASEAKPGLLETAPGGTVFLDEIGEMPLLLQAKLLRVLETRLVTRVGGLKPKAIDVRFVAATNRNLEEEVAAGRFRRDLYFRLNGMTLHIPPLRARRGEIAPLAALFLRQFSAPFGREAPDLSDEARLMLESYVWPGNVRELRNMMERAVLLCTGEEILPEHLLIESMSAAMAPHLGPAPELAARPAMPAREEIGSGLGSAPPVGFGLGPSGGGGGSTAALLPGEDERERILRVLAECGGNQSRAAKALGIARSTLVLRLNEYQVPRPRK
ncbi:MAG TPA: sigma 54-interacting transcriptional regulator [Polyangia bacterium]|nr:sigma 54-interacting transcriptional regulator [Polyangia bacterium]